MKNPRGFYLSGLFLMAFLLFCMGSIQGNPVMVKYHNQEITNSPPGQIVIAVIETPTYPVVVEQGICTQIARGVSVPIKGLMFSATANYNVNKISLCNDVALILGVRDRYFIQANIINNHSKSQPIQNCRQYTWLRGVNTRLDIGEYTSQDGVTSRHI